MGTVDSLLISSPISSWVTLLVSGAVVIYFLIFRKSRYDKMMKNVPAGPSWPILGNALEFIIPKEDYLPTIMKWINKYGPFLKFKICHRRYICLSGAKYVEKILNSAVHIEKSIDYDFLLPWLGTGLLTSKGKKWFHRRKMLTPAFHFKILDDFLVVINEQSQNLVEILKKEFSDGKPFDVYPYITRCALDIICETTMGTSINAQMERDSDYIRAIYRNSEIVQNRQVRPWVHPDFIWKLTSDGREEKRCLNILHSFTEKVIKERKMEKNQDYLDKINNPKCTEDIYTTGGRRPAFLDILIEAQKIPEHNLSDLDIREETDSFMLAGHDTTAANANWTTFLLASYPEYQEKVWEELDEIFGDDTERQITTQDLSKMKYLELCIKESLRLYPSVPFIARNLNVDVQIDNETTVPAGTTALLLIYALHRDPAVFPDPEVFLPERFLPENSVGRKPFAYVPFSAGPRNCIGQKFAMMELKVVLATLFRNFRIDAAERREDLKILVEIILRPKNGLKIKITPRKLV